MARYRKSWVNDIGWNLRLDIVPYGSGAESSLSGTITNLEPNDVTVEAEGFDVMERGFDGGVPIGLCVDSTMKITMIYNRLPSALKTYLSTKESGGERNLFLLFSDRGSAGVTYTLEGAFVQAGIGGKKYKYEGSETRIEIDLMDAAYWVLTDTTAESVFGAGGAQTAGAGEAQYFTKLYEVGFPTVSRGDAYHYVDVANGWSHWFEVGTWAYVMERLSDLMNLEYTDKAARTQNATPAAQTEVFDYLNSFHTGLFNCITLKTPVDNEVRTASVTNLDKDTLRVVTHVWNHSNVHIGGMYASEDERGWARYESVRDLLQDLAESCNGKLYYNHIYNTDAVDGDYLSLNWYWVPIGGDRTNDTAAATLDMGKALEAPETDEMEVKIGKAEVRFDTNGSDDVKETVINTGASRGSRSYNTRCIMTNAPVVKPDWVVARDLQSKLDAVSVGLFQTNTYLWVSGNTATKVHEYTKVWDTFATGTAYDDAHFQTVPSEAPSDSGLAAYNLWVKQSQSVGTLGYALASSLARVFGHNDLASITLTWKHSDYGASVLGDCLGRVHILTGQLATDTPELGWTRAVVTNVKVDWTKGTSELTYFLMVV